MSFNTPTNKAALHTDESSEKILFPSFWTSVFALLHSLGHDTIRFSPSLEFYFISLREFPQVAFKASGPLYAGESELSEQTTPLIFEDPNVVSSNLSLAPFMTRRSPPPVFVIFPSSDYEKYFFNFSSSPSLSGPLRDFNWANGPFSYLTATGIAYSSIPLAPLCIRNSKIFSIWAAEDILTGCKPIWPQAYYTET